MSRHARPYLEQQEARILYSADFAPAALVSEQAQAPADAGSQLRELVLIDARVPELQQLLDNLAAQRAAGRDLQWAVVGEGEDGIARVGAELAAQGSVGALHLIGHGDSGRMQLGESWLDGDALFARAPEIAGWGGMLEQDADLLLYGCETGAGSAGATLVQNLSLLTGADVAASDDLTGSVLLGGDWVLETRAGTIETQLVISDATQKDWVGLLATNLAPTLNVGDGRIGLGDVRNDSHGWYDVMTAVQSDGKVLVLSNTGYDASATSALTRYNVDGSLDTGFGTGGSVVLSGTLGRANQLAVDGNGNLLVGINAVSGQATVRVFSGNDGTLLATTSLAQLYVLGLVTGSGGGVLVVSGNGSTAAPTTSVQRLLSNYSVDAGFAPTNAAFNVRDVELDSAGKLLLFGLNSSSVPQLQRLNPNGSWDTSFNTSATAKIATPPTGMNWSGLQEAHLLLYPFDPGVGASVSNPRTFALIASFDNGAGGSATFGTTLQDSGSNVVVDTGWTRMDAGDLRARTVQLDAYDRILIAGERGNGTAIVLRLANITTPDVLFGAGGKLELPASDASLRSLALYPASSSGPMAVVAGVGADGGSYLRRLGYTGVIDVNFDNVKPTLTLTSTPAPTFTENAAAVVLAPGAAIYDAELSSANNFNGSSLVLQREGGAKAEDVFSASGNLAFDNGVLKLSGVVIGTVTQSAGVLTLQFNSNAAQVTVSAALQSIAYRNASDAPPASVSLSWTFGDGAGAQATATSSVSITAINDAPAFGYGDGVAVAPRPGMQFGVDMARLADGSVLMLASGGTDTLTRFDAQGKLDSSFGVQGSVSLVGGIRAASLALESNGNILVAGVNADRTAFVVQRYSAAGAYLGSVSQVLGGYVTLGDMELQANGKIVLAGASGLDYGLLDATVLRFNLDLTLDAGFGSGGVFKLTEFASRDQATRVKLQSDGALLVAGYASVGTLTQGLLLRLTANGTLDTGFSGDGWLTMVFESGEHASLSDVVIQSDGKIVVGGVSDIFSVDSKIGLARYSSTGVLDSTFGVGGVTIVNPGTRQEDPVRMAVQADAANRDKIVLVGSTQSAAGTYDQAVVLRLTVNGQLDAGFNGSGLLRVDAGPGVEIGNAVVPLADGSLLIGGATDRPGTGYDPMLLHVGSSGVLDPSFGNGRLDQRSTLVEQAANPIPLDTDVHVRDTELDALNGGLGNYSGASVVLERNGGTRADDVFSFADGSGITRVGNSLVKNGAVIASFDTSLAGRLAIVFTAVNGEVPTSLDVDAILQQILYRNTSDAPPPSVRIDWSFSDGNAGGALTASGSTTVNITAVNDAPVNTVPGPQTVDEDTQLSLGGISVNDVDGNLATTQLSVANGTLSIGNLNGAAISAGANGSATLTLSGTQAQINAALATLSYQGKPNFNGSDTLNIVSTDSDGTPLSDIDTVAITVTAVNRAPVLDASANPVLGNVLEGATNPSGTLISDLAGSSITDADGTAAKAIAITALNTGLGAWQYSLDGGAHWLTIDAAGINSSTNELALLLGPTAKIRLLPFGDLNGTLSDAITFRAWDMSSGSEGQYVTISATGGASAFSAASDTASITVLAVNDAPSFETGSGSGIVLTPISGSDFGEVVLVQPDGKLLMVGEVWSESGRFVLARYNADGSLDKSFGAGQGFTVLEIDSGQHVARGLSLQPDGKIVVAVQYWESGEPRAALLRYSVDGLLDTTFGADGKGYVLCDMGPSDNQMVAGVTVQADGKIVVAGYA
ncbi:MAG: DUF4347 domain-containing protein, partial [Rubrivivax sp.]